MKSCAEHEALEHNRQSKLIIRLTKLNYAGPAGVHAYLIKEEFLVLQLPRSGGCNFLACSLEYNRQRYLIIGSATLNYVGPAEGLGVHADFIKEEF